MKRAFVLGISLLFGIITLWAQVPQHFSYQAVIRNNDGSATASQKVSVRVSILQGSESGTVMYTETHSVKSNPNGLITLQIGDGFPVNGSFSAIDWQHGPFFLKTEVDPNGGNNLSLVSVQQLLSVPYALYAEKAGSVKDAVDKGYVDNQDNRLKDYVDSLLALFPSVDTSRIGAPVVVTDSAVVYRHYAKVSGKVLSDGGELIMSRGFCYGTKPNPTISDNYVLLGNGKGEFSGAITGLQDSVTYYVRAFATSRYGTAYGAQQILSIKSDNYNTYGIFKVSDTSYVRIAPGNMQVISDSFYFAENQYDINNNQVMSYRNINIKGNWRLLTQEEAEYLFNPQRMITAFVNGVYGFILLPDNWIAPSGYAEITAINGAYNYHCIGATEFNHNVKLVFSFTKDQWNELEGFGAVFFPMLDNYSEVYWLKCETKYDSGNTIYDIHRLIIGSVSGGFGFEFFSEKRKVNDRNAIFRLVQDVKF